MSSAADQKRAAIEFLKHSSLENLLVLDLDKMAESYGLEFKSTAGSQTVDTTNLVQSPVAYNGFKELLYECLQASLEVPLDGCKVLIRSSRTGKYADFIARFEKEFLNKILIDAFDGDGQRAVLHVEHFSFYNRQSYDARL